MAQSGLNTLEKDQLLRVIARLDERLRKVEGMLQGTEIGTVRIADAAITTAKIGSLSANVITTGVLTVRDGSAAAMISVQNAAGEEIVVLDTNGIVVNNILGDPIIELNEDGIVVNDGNIIVYNADGDPVFDALGLVSENNFQFDSINGTSFITTNSGSFVDVSGMTLSFTLARDARVLIIVSCVLGIRGPNGTGNAADVAKVALNVDGTRETQETWWGEHDAPAITRETYGSVGNHYVLNLAGGSHTIKLQWMRQDNSGASPLGLLQHRALTYLVLGQ